MKRISIFCCLVLLMNLLCPVGLAHAGNIATPTDLCEHTYHCGTYNGTCEDCGASVAEEDMVVQHWIELDSVCLYDDNNHWYICGGCNQPAFVMAHSTMDEQAYEKDAKHHWKPCYNDECGYVFPKEEHCASCTNPGVCLYCDYVGTIDEVNHTYSSDENTYSDAGHHYTCTGCGETITETHWGSECGSGEKCEDPNCTFVFTGEHNYVLKHDTSSHWYECTVCGKNRDGFYDGHEGSCTTHNVCKVCGYEGEEFSNWFHEYVFTPSSDGKTHSVACIYCDYTASGWPHWAVCNAPDTCYNCGFAGTMDDIQHTSTDRSTETYDNAGHHYICATCGKTLTESHKGSGCGSGEKCETAGCTFVFPAEHNYELKHNIFIHYYECAVCGKTKDNTHHTASCTTPACAQPAAIRMIS